MIVSRAKNSEFCIFSIVGPHCGETLESILNRKKADIDGGGFSFWNVKLNVRFIENLRNSLEGRRCYVILLEGNANDTRGNDIAKFYSSDNARWQEIPTNISEVSGNLAFAPTAFIYDKLDIADNIIVDLNMYDEATQSNAVKFSNFKTTIFAQKRERERNDGMRIHRRKIIGVLGLKYPYVVYLSK